MLNNNIRLLIFSFLDEFLCDWCTVNLEDVDRKCMKCNIKLCENCVGLQCSGCRGCVCYNCKKFINEEDLCEFCTHWQNQ